MLTCLSNLHLWDISGNLWAAFCVDRGEDQCCNLQTSFPGTQKRQEIHRPAWHLWLWELHCEQVWSLQKEKQVLTLLNHPKLKVLLSFHLSWNEQDWAGPNLFLYERLSERTATADNVFPKLIGLGYTCIMAITLIVWGEKNWLSELIRKFLANSNLTEWLMWSKSIDSSMERDRER